MSRSFAFDAVLGAARLRCVDGPNHYGHKGLGCGSVRFGKNGEGVRAGNRREVGRLGRGTPTRCRQKSPSVGTSIAVRMGLGVVSVLCETLLWSDARGGVKKCRPGW